MEIMGDVEIKLGSVYIDGVTIILLKSTKRIDIEKRGGQSFILIKEKMDFMLFLWEI